MASIAANKARGAKAERQVAEWFQAHGWPGVERRRLAGTKDAGDLTGFLNRICVEIKDTARLNLAEAVDEAVTEAGNCGADIPVVIRRRRGVPDVGRWHAVIEVATLARLLREAGYG